MSTMKMKSLINKYESEHIDIFYVLLTGCSPLLILFSIKLWSTDRSSQPDGSSSHPTSFSAAFIKSASLSICFS